MSHNRRPRLCLIGLVAALTSQVPALAQDSSDRAYRAATGLLNRGMNDMAVQEYRGFLRDNPAHAKATEARYGLAVCLARLGKPAEAATELDTVLKVKDFEFAPDAKALRGECCAAMGETEAAAKWFERVIREHPSFDRLDTVTAMYAEALYTLGNRKQAREGFEQIISRWPKSPSVERATYFLALCDAADGNYADAADRLKAFRHSKGPFAAQAALVEAQCREQLGATEEALALYKRAAESGDAAVEPDAMLGMARLKRAAGAPSEARTIIEALAKKYPAATCLQAARVELARTFYDDEKFEEAVRQLERAGEADSADVTAESLYWRAKSELKLGRASEAAQTLERAAAVCKQASFAPEILFDRGIALDKSGNEDEALKCFVTLCRHHGDHPRAADALIAAAGTLHRLEKYEDSLAACNELLEKHPKRALASDARFLAAENEYLLGRYERAERAYAEFIGEDPKNPQAARAKLRRSLALVELNRGAEAPKLLEQVLQETEDPALRRAASAALGDAAFAAKDWPRAQASYRNWLAAPGKAEGEEVILLKLAISQHRAGKPAEAIEFYARVEKDHPGTSWARQAAFERGQALAELGSLDDARKAFEHVVAEESGSKERPFTAHALRHLASIDSKQGRHSDAAARLESLTSAGDEAAADAALDRAIMLLNAGDYARAGESLSKFTSSFPDHPRAAEARAQAAIVLSRLGQTDEALSALAAVEAGSKSLSLALRAAVLYEKAWTQQQAKRDDEARSTYESLLALSDIPRSIESHAALDLAQLQLRAGPGPETLKLVDRADTAIANLPADDKTRVASRATYLRGACELALGRPESAINLLSPLAAQQSESDLRVPAALLVGEAFLRSGKAGDAAAQFRRAADLSNDPAMRSSALVRLGESAAAAQDWSASERAYSEFLESNAASELRYQAQFGIAWARENSGRHEEAVKMYRAVVAGHQGPTAARAQFQIGECLFALKRHDEAARELLKVDILYDYPEWSAAAIFEAGRCMREMGKEAEAQDHFKQVMSRFAETKWAKLANEAIAAPKKSAPLPGRPDRADAGLKPK